MRRSRRSLNPSGARIILHGRFWKSHLSQTGLYGQRVILYPKIIVASEILITLKSDYKVKRIVYDQGSHLRNA